VSLGERAAGGAVPGARTLADPEEASSVGPTAVMPAVGAVCPVCRNANHPGAALCVFCGSPIVAMLQAPPMPLAVAPTLSPGSPELDGDPPAAPVSTGRALWTEGPATGRPPPHSEPPPASLRHQPSYLDEIAGQPIADPLIGVVVAERYRIVEPLGRGGMGIVYKVEHTRIGKLLAMKLLTGELSRNPDVVRRFKQEALTASKLSSPNTVQVFDFGASEGLTYLVMELVSGEDLARVLRVGGPMPSGRLCKVVIQACSSLSEAHNKGIVHRDVKPENIMLLHAKDGMDVAKVLDFGLAKLREGAELNDVTTQGAIVGTPYFMAPEQIRGEAVDHRADIYALGALMYRALTGYYPFNGPTPMAVFTKHLTEEPIPPAERTPELGIPPGVSAIVQRALQKSPADRFQRVEDLQAALVAEVRSGGTASVEDLLDSGQLRRLSKVAAEAEQHVAGAAAVADIATRGEFERYERKLRRQRWGAFVTGAALLAGAAAGGAKLYLYQRAELARGHEIEPNNSAAEATPMPFDSSIYGYLGQRMDATHGDRDFYAVTVPATATGQDAVVALKVTALPNFAMCTMLYRQGLSTALGQYCVGRPGRDLVIPALRLPPGRYLLAVLQDLDPYDGPPPYVHENVSDRYVLSIGPAAPDPAAELEPNDQVASANAVKPGGAITGTLAWARDEDVFCVAAGTPGAIRWRVRDVVRDVGSVLEATPILGSSEGAAVRIHTAQGKVSSTDAMSPWESGPVEPAEGSPRCLRLNLTNDPWAGEAAGVIPRGGSEAYVVEVLASP
jgi:eukaryotic-like serine/threonine-protein kinase